MTANYDALIFGVGVLCIAEYVALLLFYMLHLRHHKKHPIYQIRQPLFWMATLFVVATSPLLRTIAVYLFIHSYISRETYSSLEVFRSVALTLGFAFTRCFALWYSWRLQRYEQRVFLRRHLLTSRETSSSPVPFLYRHSAFLGNAIKVGCGIQSVLMLICVVCTALALTVSSWDTFRVVAQLAMAPFLAFNVYLFASMWCKPCAGHRRLENSIHGNDKQPEQTGGTFRDDFRFRFELTLGFVAMFVSVLYQIAINNRYPPGQHARYEYGLVLALIGNFVGPSMAVVAMTAVPYYTLRQHISLFEMKKVSSPKTELGTDGVEYRVVGLLDVLTHKSGFYAFVDHLVQELSFENLSYLVDLFQFKHGHQDIVEQLPKKMKFREHLRRKAHRHHTKKAIARKHSADLTTLAGSPSNLDALVNPQMQTNDGGNLDGDLGVGMSRPRISQVAQVSNSTSATEEPSFASLSLMSIDSENYLHSVLSEYSRQTNGVNVDYFRRVLQKMPWDGLPLTPCMTSSGTDNKLQQAQNIFDRYINRDSYYSVNISPGSVFLIEGLLQRLHAYARRPPQTENNDDDIEIVTSPEPDNTLTSKTNANGTLAADDTFSELPPRDELKEAENIRDEAHFNSILMSLFDSSLSDVFHNLEGSMTRFRITDEFLRLSGK